jgi:hypothetical protein
MLDYYSRKILVDKNGGGDGPGAPADRGRSPDALTPIDQSLVVGAIRARAPELSDDLDDAITVWLEQAGGLAIRAAEPGRPTTRRSRLEALRELLALGPYEPDSRD